EPRNEIEPLIDEAVRRPLEDVDLQLFSELDAGDFLFFDGSHRALQNSDVTVFFLDVLPKLKPGVVVHLHDIYLPYDYPTGHLRRLWNEQYLLAMTLLYGARQFELLFPSWFVTCDKELVAQARQIFGTSPLSGLSMHGASFWLRMPMRPRVNLGKNKT